MYIEQIISVSTFRVKFNHYDLKIMESFFDQTTKGLGLTEKQSNIAVKILKRYLPQLNAIAGKDISSWLDNPIYKFGLRTITTVKNISVVKDDSGSKLVKVQFPYDDSLLNEIKKERGNFISAEWKPDEKCWKFLLQDQVVAFLAPWLLEKGFTADDEFKRYADQIEAITSKVENYVPMLSFVDGNAKIINAHSSVPQPTSNDIIEAIFKARRAGITIWDQSVEDELNTHPMNDVVKNFIKSEIVSPFSINLEENSILDLIPIINNLSPCIVTVPGGNELSKTKLALELLHAAGIDNGKISVLFRLPTETGSEFNNFVKDEKLNSPISDSTKVVFLSGKVPKPVFESTLKFNCVLNFNFYNVHYTLANFIKSQHNVINVLADKKQKVS